LSSPVRGVRWRGPRLDVLQGEPHTRLDEGNPEVSPEGLPEHGDSLPGCGAHLPQAFRRNPADEFVGIAQSPDQDVEDQRAFVVYLPQGHGRPQADGWLLIPEAGMDQGGHRRPAGPNPPRASAAWKRTTSTSLWRASMSALTSVADCGPARSNPRRA